MDMFPLTFKNTHKITNYKYECNYQQFDYVKIKPTCMYYIWGKMSLTRKTYDSENGLKQVGGVQSNAAHLYA